MGFQLLPLELMALTGAATIGAVLAWHWLQRLNDNARCHIISTLLIVVMAAIVIIYQ